MRAAMRRTALAAILAGACPAGWGYYPWTYYANRAAPFRPVPARFDLNALPGKTAYYFISEQGPGPLTPGDSFPSIVSQIRAAAAAWDDVATSDLRVKFGGFAAAALQAAPGIDVVFDDEMPPGVLAQTYLERPEDLSAMAAGASFVPILRSRVQIRRDLTAKQQASYLDSFFTTLVHEFGHALGLQHTLTSAAMSTAVTRATTKARPLAADDVAGISFLYPTAEFAVVTGSISGQVTLGGAGVNLASVAAISTSGTAVSAMTNPDGTYRIAGIPPGAYYVYVHPLPAPLAQAGETTPANIVPPVDAQNIPFAAYRGFVTQFFPGTRDWTQAIPLEVAAGGALAGVNLSVQASGGPVLGNMQTLQFQGPNRQVPVWTPSIVGGRRDYLWFYADGALNGTQLAPGLTVRALGPGVVVEPASVQFYAPNFVLMIVNLAPVTEATPVALAVTVNNDLYVLPAAFTVVPTGPPAVTSVSGTSDLLGNTTVTVGGANLRPETRVMFDGAAGQVQEARTDGSLVVSAPPASGSHRAAVVALNADGQTSTQALGTAVPPLFTYSVPDVAPVISVSPPFVPAGADSMIEVTGFSGAQFVDGQVAVGFGTSDIAIRRMWVVDHTKILLNISVLPGAAAGSTTVTVSSGLQLVMLKTILQIQPYNPRVMSLKAPVVNAETGTAGVQAGRTAVISTQGLPPNLGGWTLAIGGAQTNILLGGGSQIYAQVPAGTPLGPATVRLAAPGGEYVPAIVMQVDAAPPVITQVALGGQPMDPSRAARAGDTLVLTVSGLAEPGGATPPAGSVKVRVAGVEHTAQAVLEVGGTHLVLFTLSPLVPFGPQQPVMVGVGTRFSLPVMMGVRN
jgi:hypothetical protein